MDRADFLSLPPGFALRILFDALDEETVRAIERVEKPEIPRAPKFESVIYRQGGVQYASETNLESLTYWYNRAKASAESGGKWADKDQRNAANLAKWIAYREFFPDVCWSGERNDEVVVAAPPSAKPRVYAKGGGAARPAPPKQQEAPPDDYFGSGAASSGGAAGAAGYSDADYGGGEDEIPF